MRMTVPGWIVVAAATTSWMAAGAADAEFGVSRAELVHRWDLNKDGTIDEAEAEVARAKMRRQRLDLQHKAATEKPLVPGSTPVPTSNGATPDRDPLGEAFLPPKPTPPNPAEKAVAKEPSKPERQLNAGRPKDRTTATPDAPRMRSDGIGGPVGGGIVTGGVRAGAPAIRPGYGAKGPKVDLNAGRLPAGLPPARGMPPQAGSAPFRSGVPGIAPRGTASRPGIDEPPRPPLVPSSPTRVSAEDIGL